MHHRCDRADFGIVYQHGQASVLLQRGLNAREILMLAEIGHEDFNRPAGVITDPGSQRVESSPVAGDECKVIAAPREPLSVGRTNATRGSGDEGRPVAMKRHSVFPRMTAEVGHIYAS